MDPLQGHWILVERKVLQVDLFTWAQWMEQHNKDRIVKQEQVAGVRVSTVFLGIDHNFFGEGPPLLFETMVFGGPLDQECVRYSTYDEALQGHGDMLIRVAEAGVTWKRP